MDTTLYLQGDRVIVRVHELRETIHGTVQSSDGDGYYTVLSDAGETWALCHEDMMSLEPRA